MTPCISSKMCVITYWRARDSYFHHLYVQIYSMKCELQSVKFLGVFCTMYIKRMRAAPKLSKTVLHPGNCKQSVPVALAIFDTSTKAAILKYYPQAQDSADFINLFHTWWMVSNSKQRFRNGSRLGDAAMNTTVSQYFFQGLLNGCWNGKIRSFLTVKKFTLSA